MFVTRIAAVILLLLTSGFANAGEDGPLVVIQDYKFIPQHIEVKKGATVVWENREKRQYHSVWFESLGEEAPDYFFPEETFERTFDTVGTFDYRCGPHPEMTGSVTVVE